jgi:hypothetical protein
MTGARQILVAAHAGMTPGAIAALLASPTSA